MTYAISLTSAARLEVIDAVEWYEDRVAGLGADFEDEVDRLTARIAENPLQFPITSGARHAHLRKFPYDLVFFVEGQTAFIIACFHSSRDPRLLKTRR